mgnify:CR=1 FL=1
MENKNYFKLKYYMMGNIKKIHFLFDENLKNISDEIVLKKLEKALEYNLFSDLEKKNICKYIFYYTKSSEFKQKYFYYFKNEYWFYNDFKEILYRGLYDYAFKILEDNLEFINKCEDIRSKIIKDLLKMSSFSFSHKTIFSIKDNNELINRYFNLLTIFFDNEPPFYIYKLLYECSQSNKNFLITKYLKKSNIYEITVNYHSLQKIDEYKFEYIRRIIYKIAREILREKITTEKRQQVIDSLNFIKIKQLLHSNTITYIDKLKKDLLEI